MPGPYNTDTTAEVIVHDLASEISGKVVLITGVSPGGLGAVFVNKIVVANPALLILAGRNPSKTQAAADTLSKINPKVRTRTLELDLGSLKTVRKAAAEVNGWANVPKFDVLVNNAGIMACEYGKTEDGIEQQFAVGHIGPFLFTNLIMKKIMAASAPRIINVSSDGHRLSAMRWPDIGFSVSQNSCIGSGSSREIER
jgi:NAD(P)-dependent dehydrogenase (short-subunit alcohol dehydrogenase family)